MKIYHTNHKSCNNLLISLLSVNSRYAQTEIVVYTAIQGVVESVAQVWVVCGIIQVVTIVVSEWVQSQGWVVSASVLKIRDVIFKPHWHSNIPQEPFLIKCVGF